MGGLVVSRAGLGAVLRIALVVTAVASTGCIWRVSSPGGADGTGGGAGAAGGGGGTGGTSGTSGASGTGGAGGTGATNLGASWTVEPAYPGFANWNDYILRDPAVVPYQLPALPCSGDELGGPNRCLHAGERVRVRLDGINACNDVKLNDFLNAFDWRCWDEVTGPVAYTTGLAQDRGLRDLVDASGWLPNHLVVRDTLFMPLAESPPQVWWGNPVVPLPGCAGQAEVSLDQSSTVYVLDTSQTDGCGYSVDADHVALVTLEGTQLSHASGGAINCERNGTGTADDHSCLVEVLSRRFTWLEGGFVGDRTSGTSLGLLVYDARFTRLHQVTIDSTGDSGLRLLSTQNTLGTNVQQYRSGDCGVDLSESSFNAFYDTVVEFNANEGIELRGTFGTSDPAVTSGNNVFVGLILTNNSYGVSAGCGQHSNTYVNVLATFNSGSGIFSTCSNDAVISHVTSVNNEERGIDINQTSRHTLAQVVTANSGRANIRHDNNANRVTAANIVAVDGAEVGLSGNGGNGNFIGHLVVGNNGGQDCDAAGPGCGLIDTTCTDDGLDGSSSYTGELSSAILHPNQTSVRSFVGQISTDDTVNLDDINGRTTVLDPTTRFETPWRVWGYDGGVYPAAAQRGQTVVSTGLRIWDFRLDPADSVLFERRATGLTSAFVDGGPCPAAVGGDVTITNPIDLEVLDDGIGNEDGACDGGEACHGQSQFLINATEVVLDDMGDDDGLCESNERCIYSPHFGAFQGEGNPRARDCLFADGDVSGVLMFTYPP